MFSLKSKVLEFCFRPNVVKRSTLIIDHCKKSTKHHFPENINYCLSPPPLPKIKNLTISDYVNLSSEDSPARLITQSDRKMEVQDMSESIKRLNRRGSPNQPFQNQPFPSSTQSSPYLLWLQTALLPNPFNS